MRVLVTGANGMLGTDLSIVLNRRGVEAIPYTHETLDITDARHVNEALSTDKPDAVIHTAAYTNVDDCQNRPDYAYGVNTVGTINLALACAESNTPLVYISSCGVFDGQKATPYHEFDPVGPLTHYHNSKYQGELAIRDFCRKFFIVRPGWLFGGHAAHKKNFVAARMREAATKPQLQSANDKFGSPTYTLDLAETIVDLIGTEAYGLCHAANSGMASRYDYVTAIMGELNLPNEVHSVSSDQFPRAAPVPNCEALDNMALRLRGFTPMRPWQDALSDYVQHRFKREL